ncbi:MAG TPA: hypothetical protein VM901_11655 [Bdellovibrionota bacterium]|jgi:hypothetical protein|nr:hypothetical protein [Bdellovibrionota bacterium]
MKRNVMHALALAAGLSAMNAVAANQYNQYETGYQIARSGGNFRNDYYTFSCVATALVHRGQEVFTHTINVDGEIDANRRTLAGEPVHVAVNGRAFAKFLLPQHTIWIKDGELLSLSLSGISTKGGEEMRFFYGGEGNLSQNRVELSRGRRSLRTGDISCKISRADW